MKTTKTAKRIVIIGATALLGIGAAIGTANATNSGDDKAATKAEQVQGAEPTHPAGTVIQSDGTVSTVVDPNDSGKKTENGTPAQADKGAKK
ncbi:hypothetical protein [Streptomyces sp. NPDC002851]